MEATYQLTATGQLHCDELFLVVLLKCRRKLRNQVGGVDGKVLNIYSTPLMHWHACGSIHRTGDNICELFGVSIALLATM